MKAVFTGGGTAGHVMVNRVLIPMLREEGWEVAYVGSRKGAERSMVEGLGLCPYHGIFTGKLRRYVSLHNLLDFFRVWVGLFQALGILLREKPQVVFSGGGFVSVPVMVAAWLCGIPSLIRETDCSMGLANRICIRFAKRIFLPFPGTIRHEKADSCGIIVRPELLDATASREYLPFASGKPTVLVMGGSLGAKRINAAVWDSLPRLLERYNILHICGRGKVNAGLGRREGYRQCEYIDDMAGVYAGVDAVITRSGSNAVCECLALGKRMLCVPLAAGSRGEQAENARYAARHGCAVILPDSGLTAAALLEGLEELFALPLNSAMTLTREQLLENCRAQLAAIRQAAGGQPHQPHQQTA